MQVKSVVLVCHTAESFSCPVPDYGRKLKQAASGPVQKKLDR